LGLGLRLGLGLELGLGIGLGLGLDRVRGRVTAVPQRTHRCCAVPQLSSAG